MSAPPPAQPSTPPADHPATTAVVLRQFRQVFNAVKTHFQQVEKRAGIGGAQLWALSLVHAQPGLGIVGLCREMDIHQTTASNLVRALVEAGLVVSQKSAADKRAVVLAATPAGRRVLRQAPGPWTGVLPDALAKLDDAALQRLAVDLDALIQVLDADAQGSRVPLGS